MRPGPFSAGISLPMDAFDRYAVPGFEADTVRVILRVG